MNLAALTASKLPLADHCLAWVHLPHLDHGADAARSVGNAFDELVTSRINRGAAVLSGSYSEATIAEAWALYSAWFAHVEENLTRTDRPEVTWRAQVAYAANPVTRMVRELGQEIGRDYVLHDGEIAGTLDVLVVNEAARVVVIHDTKTGHQARTRSRSVAENRQLRFLGWCARQAFRETIRKRRGRPLEANEPTVFVSLDYVSASGVTEDMEQLRGWELEHAIPHELSALIEDAETPDASGQPSPGTHCTEMFCPAYASCPAIRERAYTLAPDDVRHLPVLAEPAALTDAAKARAVYDGLRAIDGLSDRWWPLLDAWVDDHGAIDLDSGARYAAVTQRRESLEYGPGALGVLLALMGEQGRSAIELSLTKGAIGRVSREIAGAGRGGAELERAVMQGLREAGAVRESTGVRHEVVRAKAPR